MRIYINTKDNKSFIIELDDNNSLEFEALKSLNTNKKVVQGTDEFYHLNKYWETFTKEQQLELFNLYKEIHESVEDFRTVQTAISYLKPIMKQIADNFHDLENIASFLENEHIDYGGNILEDNENLRNDMSPESTYNKSEYFELCCLTIAYKAFLPIWHMWIKFNPGRDLDDGKAEYQIFELFAMLSESHLVDNSAFTKLETYCKHHYLKQSNGTGDKKVEVATTASVMGCGSAQFPLYLTGRVIMDRLARSHINDPGDKVTLISATYGKIMTDIGSLTSAARKLRARNIDNKHDGFDDEKIGYFEAMNSYQRTDDSVPLLHQKTAYDYRKLKRHIDTTIPTALVKTCIDSFNEHNNGARIGERRILAKWVLNRSLHNCNYDDHVALRKDEVRISKPVFDYRAVDDIDRFSTINALAVTQAALIHWNMRSLAMLISAVPIDIEDTVISTAIDVFDVSIKNKLLELNPYFRPNSKSPSKTPTAWCSGYVDIEEIILNYYVDKRLDVRCSDELAAELKIKPGITNVPVTIRNDLANLLCFIGKNL